MSGLLYNETDQQSDVMENFSNFLLHIVQACKLLKYSALEVKYF